MPNVTLIMDFLLLQFSEEHELQILHVVLFLAMYLAVLMGNLLIILLVALNTNLQTPMYFFLVNLSIVDVGSSSVTIPRSIANALRNTTQISYSECVAQILLFAFFLSSDLFLLAAMAYDRYVAICQPLHYVSLMRRSSCIQLAGGAWVAGLLNAALHTGTIFSLPFCSNKIHQFFCEIPHLIEISCSDSYFSKMSALLFSVIVGLVCFAFIVISYMQIFSTLFRMPSVAKRQKAFSTCIPHLTVVSLLIFTGIFSNVISTSSSSYNLNKVLTVIYSVLPPMMNPIIYSMRNKDIKAALWELLYRKLPTRNAILF